MNYYRLLNVKYRIKYLYYILLFSLFLTILIIGNKQIANIYVTVGYVDNQELIINVPISNSNVIDNLEYIEIDKEKYYPDTIVISPIMLDEYNMVNYQELRIVLEKELPNNIIKKCIINYDKEKVFSKIKRLLW